MKITISGWAGAGSSTLALILADSLNFTLIQGGEVFRYLYKELSYNTTGAERNQAHNYVEPHFGPLYDDFIDWFLQNDAYQNYIIESDITSFRLGKKPNILSIFLHATRDARAKRTQGDDRPEDGEVMEEIDTEHAAMYKQLHDIDFMDLDAIRASHQLVIDNSDASIADELVQITQLIPQFGNTINIKNVTDHATSLEANYWKQGKDVYKQTLREKGQLASPEEILTHMLQQFPDRIHAFPEDLRKVIEDVIEAPNL